MGYVLVVIHVLMSIFVSFASVCGCIRILQCTVCPAWTTVVTVAGVHNASIRVTLARLVHLSKTT